MTTSRRSGFTLVELLAVIAIVALIIAIFLPGLTQAMERARQVKCKNNLRNIGMAMIAFADDHDGRLNACYYWPSSPKPWQMPMVGKEVVPPGSPPALGSLFGGNSDRVGTLLEYLPVSESTAHRIWRCPSLKVTGIGSGSGSNSMFDYTMMFSLAGTPLGRIPQRMTIYPNDSKKRRDYPTALVVEESPKQLNTVNMDPGFSNVDEFAWEQHDGYGFFCAVDGSVAAMGLNADGRPVICNDCHVEVNGEWYSLGSAAPNRGGTQAFGLLPWDVR
jgi:prepilin-type N-terminal cleavage/methylation domain-containing protein